MNSVVFQEGATTSRLYKNGQSQTNRFGRLPIRVIRVRRCWAVAADRNAEASGDAVASRTHVVPMCGEMPLPIFTQTAVDYVKRIEEG
jgi:hypothetical protein